MDSMLVMEDLSDDDSSYSNSTYSSFCFWSIEACGESPYSCTWSMDTSIWSSDSICSDSSYRSICSSKTYSADSLCTSTVSTDTLSDSSSNSMWSVTSLEGNWDFDIQGDFVASKEEEFDGTNNICDDPSIPKTTKKQNFKRIGKGIKRLIMCNRRSNKDFPIPM